MENTPCSLSLGREDLQTLKEETAQLCNGATAEDVEEVFWTTPLQAEMISTTAKFPKTNFARYVYTLPLEVDVGRFARSWQTVIDACPTLRVRMVDTRRWGIVQVVLRTSFCTKALWSNPEASRDTHAQAASFGDPLLFMWMAGANFTIRLHDSILDQWSMRLVTRDVAQVYEAANLTPRPSSKAIGHYVHSMDVPAAEKFWSRYLSGATASPFPAIRVPLEQSRLEIATQEIPVVRNDRSRCTFATPTLLQAAWGLMLCQYLNLEDITFGLELTGRNLPIAGIEEIVGQTGAMVLARVRMVPEMKVDELLQQVQDGMMEMAPYQHLGLERIGRIGAQAKVACDIHSVLRLDSRVTHPEESELSHSLCQIRQSKRFQKYALAISCVEDRDKINLVARYDPHAIDGKQIRRILALLGDTFALLDCHGSRLLAKDAVRITADDQGQIFRWNAQMPDSVDHCVHDLIEKQILSNPEAEAVCAWDGSLTYNELGSLSTRLAKYLQSCGVGPEAYIPYCFEKSLWTIVAVLGIMKAGGICVPLDPSIPFERKLMIIKETNATVLVASVSQSTLFADAGLSIIPIGNHTLNLSQHTLQELQNGTAKESGRLGPSSTAYVLFTSGSTGQPKGVVWEHAALSTSLLRHGKALKLTPKSRVLQFAAHAWDQSVFEMLATTVAGGCVCVPSANDTMNRLTDCINEMNVNWIFLTPTLARTLNPADLPTLKIILIGGEAMGQDNLDTWAVTKELFQMYGPTECCIYTTMAPMLSANAFSDNIGWPVAARCWLTDPYYPNKLVPIGAVGEILIEGPILARGYLNDNVKTAASFVKRLDWSIEETGGQTRRFFRTGDLGKYSSDGSIRFVGRRDGQVKVRGQRLELSEVEQLITHHARVLHSCVVYPSAGMYRKQLVAVVVMGGEVNGQKAAFQRCTSIGGKSFAAQNLELEGYLSKALPSHAIPHVWIYVQDLPRALSGKLDKVVIQGWVTELNEDDVHVITQTCQPDNGAPATAVEQCLQAGWAKVLNIPPSHIGHKSSFFRLGGDSIRAMQLVIYMKESGFSLTVADIFGHPELDALAACSAPLDEQKSSQLAPFSLLSSKDHLEGLIREVAVKCGMEDDGIEDIYPATSLQEGLIATTTRQAGSYVAQFNFAIPPEIDIDRLSSAWECLVEARAILRTRLVNTESQGTVQVVLRADCLRRMFKTKAEVDPTLSLAMSFGDPLLQTVVNPHEFIITMHHALFDGWSLALMMRDLSNAYATGSLIRRPHFQHFIRYLQKTSRTECEAYWSRYLAGAAPSAFPKLKAATTDPCQLEIVNIDIPMSRRPGSGITTATIVQVAWGLVVARYMDVDDITFGVVVSGREAPVESIEKILGPTIATIPQRLQLSRKISINDLLKETQRNVAHRIPYEQFGLQSISRISEELRAACMFQNIVVVHPPGNGITSAEKLLFDTTDEGIDYIRSYGLTVECSLNNTGLSVRAYFNPTCMDGVQTRRVLGQFSHTLNTVALEEPDLKVENAVQLTKADELEIRRWNSEIPCYIPQCAHQLFELQVALSPQATAITSWDGTLTYRQLDQLSTRLAGQLISLGVGFQAFVPFYFEKSIWAVVTILAIMKAGGICVPLDPSHPRNRVAGIIRDTGAQTVITSPQNKDPLRGLVDNVVVVTKSFIEASPQQPSLPTVRPKDAAYVIFTSGSTGRPKGVIWEHQMLSTTLTHHGKMFQISLESRVLQFAAYVFDVSVSDIMASLTYGACICIPSEDDRMGNLANAIATLDANFVHLTPTTVRLLDPRDVPMLKTLVVGGEAIDDDLARLWRPHVRLLQGYGTAECGIDCCISSLDDGIGSGNIGRPVGAAIWITDSLEPNRLLPIGAVGEIVVQGPILAKGYLGHEDETPGSFMHTFDWASETSYSWMNGFGSKQSPRFRFYRTGDLGKYNTDGTISFLGRRDGQIKVRGQRLELGEIEHHLSQHPAIGHLVAAFPQQGAYHEQVVVVLTLKNSVRSANATVLNLHQKSQAEEISAHISEFEDYIAEKVPSGAIPRAWIPVEDLPRTASGKLDRMLIAKWVAGLGQEMVHTISQYMSSTNKDRALTPMELQLQHIWANVLDVAAEEIGRTKSFFRLGGDSISAIQIVEMCRKAGFLATVQDILRSKTIERLALAVKRTATATVHVPNRLDELFDLAPIQKMYTQLSSSANGQTYQSFLLALDSRIRPENVSEAFHAIVRHHPMLRSRFVRDGSGTWRQLITSQLAGSYHFGIVQFAAEDRVEALIDTTKQRLDPESGPVFAAELVLGRPGGHILFATAHHLVIDLVSWRVILRDLEELLEGRALPDPSTSFQTWTRMQASYTQNHIQPHKTVPFDVPVSNYRYWGMHDISNLDQDSIHQSFYLDRGVTAILLGSANDAYRTQPLDLMLSALFIAFGQSFQDRKMPAIFNEAHGREPWEPSIDLSRTVGWFTTIYPIAVADGSFDITGVIRHVKDLKRQIPCNGWAYFASRYLTIEGGKYLEKEFPVEVLFNFAGSFQQLERQGSRVRQIPWDINQLHGSTPLRPRTALLSVAGVVTDKALQFYFTWNRHMKHQTSLELFMGRFEEVLKSMAVRLPQQAPEPTLSDFPLLKWGYSDISRFVKEGLLAMELTDIDGIQNIYPCSPIQQGILVSRLKNPGQYRVQIIARLSTPASVPMDMTRLANAWKMIINRHDTLRTVFGESGAANGPFQQVVLAKYDPEILCIDRSTQAECLQTLQDYPSFVDDIFWRPQHRMVFCRASEDESTIFSRLDINHALIDAASTSTLWRDICLAYDGLIDHGRVPQYSQYIEYLQNQSLEVNLNYWKDYLKKLEPCILPCHQGDKSSSSNQIHVAKVDLDDTKKLLAFCKAHDCTVANLLQTSWAFLLQAYTGNSSPCFGYLSSGRDIPITNVKDAVGPYIAMLICRVDIGSSRTKLLDTLEKVQGDFIEGMSHSHCSLADVYHELDLPGQSLFNTVISAQTSQLHGKQPEEGTQYSPIHGQDPTEVS